MCSFAKYLQYEVVDRMTQWQRIMGIPPVKSPKQEVNYLEMEAISLLFKQIDTCNNHGRRNMALLTLMYNTGCRVQELIDLTPSSLRLETGIRQSELKEKEQKHELYQCSTNSLITCLFICRTTIWIKWECNASIVLQRTGTQTYKSGRVPYPSWICG